MIDSKPISLKGFVVWLLCVLFYFYEFLLRTVLGTFQFAIRDDLQIGPVDFAFLSSTAYLFVYGIMQIPVGTLLIRFGLKKSLAFACFVCCIANLGFACSHHYSIALLFRFLMGFGSSFGYICLLVAVYDWVPYHKIALYIGLSQLLGTLGPMLAGGPINTMAESATITWRTIFFLLSLFGLFLTFLIMILVDKNQVQTKPDLILNKPVNVIKNILGVIQKPQVWFIAIFCAFVYFALEYLSENECKYFLLAKGFSSGFSSYMITTAWLGFAISAPILGFISDQIRKRKPILLFSSAVTVIALTAIIYVPLNKIEMFTAFLLFGVGVGSASVGMVIMGEQLCSSSLSMGLGLNNATAILFVSMMAPLLQTLLSYIGQEPHLLRDYQIAFSVLVLLPLTALFVAMLTIRETHGKSSQADVVTHNNAPQAKNLE